MLGCYEYIATVVYTHTHLRNESESSISLAVIKTHIYFKKPDAETKSIQHKI